MFVYIYMKCERKQTKQLFVSVSQGHMKVMVILYDADNVLWCW